MKKNKKLILIAVLVLAMAGLAAWYFLVKKKEEEEEEAQAERNIAAGLPAYPDLVISTVATPPITAPAPTGSGVPALSADPEEQYWVGRIFNDPKWLSDVTARAKQYKMPVEDRVLIEAKYMKKPPK